MRTKTHQKALDLLLPRLQTKAITQKEAAQALGITPRHLRRLLPEGFKPTNLAAKEATEAAKEALKRRQNDTKKRRDAALLLYKGQISVEIAAKRAGCSERTIFRYLKHIRDLLGHET